jgi:dTDP-4-amino-4,6-dideoxygalactose transaminase
VAAVVPVHLYGQPADMDPILELAARYNLVVIEDACQAHGAEYYSARERRWRKAGSMGRAAAFSFYPGKNLGACGEGGAVTTDDPDLARQIRMLRDHGQSRKYFHDVEGYNGRLDAIQAGILQVKLKHLPDWTARRREAAARYNELFAQVGHALACPSPGGADVTAASCLTPFEPAWTKPVYHVYAIRVPDREGLMRQLAGENIGAAIHYPGPLHLQKAYKWMGYRPGDFPIAEKVADEIVSLPMFPQLTGDQQARVAAGVTGFLSTAEMAVAAQD